MHLIKIDSIRVQSLQRSFASADDMKIAATLRIWVCVAHLSEELRRNDELVSLPFDRLAKDFFALASRVDVGRIEEVDSQIERFVGDLESRLFIGAPVLWLPSKGHGAEARLGDLHTCPAKRNVLHLVAVYLSFEATW